jgi:hypothetical protein
MIKCLTHRRKFIPLGQTWVAKSKLSILKMIFLGFRAGAYLGFGAYGFIVFITTYFDPALQNSSGSNLSEG